MLDGQAVVRSADKGILQGLLPLLGGRICISDDAGKVRLGVQVHEQDLLAKLCPGLSHCTDCGSLAAAALVVNEAYCLSHNPKSFIMQR